MSAYYTMTIVLCLLSMLIMMLVVWSGDAISSLVRHRFVILFGVVALAAVAEWGGVQLQGTGSSTVLVHGLIKATELSCTPMLGPLAAGILGSGTSASKVRMGAVCLALAANAVLEFLSVPFGLVFVVDAQSAYSHAGLYWVYELACLASMAYLVVASAKVSTMYQGCDNNLLLFIMVLILVGLAAQMVDSSIKVDWICLPMAAMLFYIYYVNIILETDSLTMLLNRRSYDSALTQTDEPLALLIFDVDNFKRINDDYGHAVGDDCLRQVGSLLRGAYAEHGRCYRIGGDEFCVVMRRDLDRVDALSSTFFNSLTEVRKDKDWMPWVSMGKCDYDPATDDIAAVIEQADRMMYRFKARYNESLR